MSLRKTMLLAGILLLALYYIFKYQMPARVAEQKKDFLFPDLKASAVESIAVENEKSSFVMQSVQAEEKTRWELAEPRGASLEPALVNGLLTALRELKLENPLPQEDIDSDLSVYGLTKPIITLTVKTKSENRKLLLGKSNQYLSKRYFKLESDPRIYMIADALFSAADKSKEEFRDKTPFDYSDADLRSIMLNSKDSEVLLEKVLDKQWMIKKPLEIRADTDVVSEFNRSLRNLKAEEFLETTKMKELGFEIPQLKIALNFKPESKLPDREILLTEVKAAEKDKADYYLYEQGSPSILKLSSNPFILLNKKADQFRERRLFSFATDKVKSAKATLQDGSIITLEKEAKEWKINGKNGDKIFIDQWLRNLSELEAVAFPKGKSDLGFEKPTYALSLELSGEEGGSGITRSLVIGKSAKIDESGEVYYALADDKENPFMISDDSYKKIALREEALLPQKKPEAPTATSIPE